MLDLMMPKLNGFEFLESFHGTAPKPRSVIFVITAFDDSKVAKLEAGHGRAHPYRRSEVLDGERDSADR